LTGHSLAVTSVDWRRTAIGNIVATCADDQTVLLYDGQTFELKSKLHTSDIPDWHTVTYLSLEEKEERADEEEGGKFVQEGEVKIQQEDRKRGRKGSRRGAGKHLVVATQNGYIVVWDLETGTKVFGNKMHVGSIEGLAICHSTGLIASCSSDCSVNVYKLKLH
jgi:WD40 repeat protein